MTKSERIDYLDMAKGIGILLVIIGHISYVSEPVRQYISSFHMPLFFVISGILLCYKQEENNNLKDFACRKFKGLMIPYFIFSVCVLLIESVRILWKDANTWDNILRQLFQTVCLQGVSVLWFLPSLFMAEIGFLWLKKKTNHSQTVIFLALLSLLSYAGSLLVKRLFAENSNLLMELCYDMLSMVFRNLLCVCFVGVGYYFALLLFRRKRNVAAELSLSTILLVFIGVVLMLNGAVDLRGMNLGNILWFLIGGICGSVGIIFLCRLLDKLPIKYVRMFLMFMGCNSLLIMVTHLDFRVLYISIRLAEWVKNTLIYNETLFCISIVVFVILIETLIIAFVGMMKRVLQRNKLKNS